MNLRSSVLWECKRSVHAAFSISLNFLTRLRKFIYLLETAHWPSSSYSKVVIGASLSEPHCYVANRGKRNALWCVRTRNFSTVIKIPSACDRNFYQFVVNLPIVFPSSQLLRQFAWLRISQDASHFARRNLLAELVEQ